MAEFFIAAHHERVADTYHTVKAILEGTMPAPASWKHATVTLIPKIASPVEPTDYRPITALPAIQQLVLRCWMSAAPPISNYDVQEATDFDQGTNAPRPI